MSTFSFRAQVRSEIRTQVPWFLCPRKRRMNSSINLGYGTNADDLARSNTRKTYTVVQVTEMMGSGPTTWQLPPYLIRQSWHCGDFCWRCRWVGTSAFLLWLLSSSSNEPLEPPPCIASYWPWSPAWRDSVTQRRTDAALYAASQRCTLAAWLCTVLSRAWPPPSKASPTLLGFWPGSSPSPFPLAHSP